VAEDAWPLFFSRLQDAEADLARAIELDPEDPTPWEFLLRSGRGLQIETDELVERFQAARARHPEDYRAHQMLLLALCQKWGHSHEMMFDFARQVAEAVSEGSGVHALVPQAHVERWLYFSMEEPPDHDGNAATCHSARCSRRSPTPGGAVPGRPRSG